MERSENMLMICFLIFALILSISEITNLIWATLKKISNLWIFNYLILILSFAYPQQNLSIIISLEII